MDADEIIPLTAESIADLVRNHRVAEAPESESGNRRAPRWPFPGAMQLWVADESGTETILFGTCDNISTAGLAGRIDEPLPVGVTIPIAIHLPQATYHGRATVRHCTQKKRSHFVGLEFDFA